MGRQVHYVGVTVDGQPVCRAATVVEMGRTGPRLSVNHPSEIADRTEVLQGKQCSQIDLDEMGRWHWPERT